MFHIILDLTVSYGSSPGSRGSLVPCTVRRVRPVEGLDLRPPATSINIQAVAENVHRNFPHFGNVITRAQRESFLSVPVKEDFGSITGTKLYIFSSEKLQEALEPNAGLKVQEKTTRQK